MDGSARSSIAEASSGREKKKAPSSWIFDTEAISAGETVEPENLEQHPQLRSNYACPKFLEPKKNHAFDFFWPYLGHLHFDPAFKSSCTDSHENPEKNHACSHSSSAAPPDFADASRKPISNNQQI